MLLTMELDSVVWFVKGIEDRSEKQERQIDDAQNLRRINQRKEILLWGSSIIIYLHLFKGTELIALGVNHIQNIDCFLVFLHSEIHQKISHYELSYPTRMPWFIVY